MQSQQAEPEVPCDHGDVMPTII